MGVGCVCVCVCVCVWGGVIISSSALLLVVFRVTPRQAYGSERVERLQSLIQNHIGQRAQCVC